MKNKKLKYKWEIDLDYFIKNKMDYKINNYPEKAIDKVSVTHIECGRTFNTTARRIKVASCPCLRDHKPNKKTHKNFVNQIKDIYDDKYTILGEYQNAKTPLAIRHNICNKEYESTPNAILSNSGCPYCFGKERLTHKEFVEMVYRLVGKEYTVLTKYSLSRKKLKIRHNICKNEYLVTPNKFIMGRRCPNCSSSRGENRISEWLNRNNITFISEYSFEDLKGRSNVPLKFDFAIINKDNTIHSLIEFDGRQHFEAIDFFGGEKEFKRTVKLDTIKNKYCLDNKIKLLRIPHTDEDNTERIIDKWLTNY